MNASHRGAPARPQPRHLHLHRPGQPVEAEAHALGVSACSDGELLARIASGDASALDELIARYWSQLLDYVARRTGSRDAASDVVQDAFCRVWERRSSWRREGSVRGLLYRLARNFAISEHRRLRVQDRVHAVIADRPGWENPVGAWEGRELGAALEAAVSALPERRREVFLLRVSHELSYREIAEVMGTSTQTVANQLSHALATLRRSLTHLLD